MENKTVDPESLGGYFPLTAIRCMIFGDHTLEDIKPLSKTPGDTAKVVIVPLAIGKYLEELDKSEVLFHLEHYENHSEVWLRFEWLESNSRLMKQRERCRVEREERDKYHTRITELVALMPPQMGETFNRHLAILALKMSKEGKTADRVLSMLNIAELLQRYVEEDKQEGEQDGTTKH